MGKAADGAGRNGRGSAGGAPFAWRDFLGALASFGLFVVLLGGLVGVSLGQRILERRVATQPGTPATSIDIRWPTFARGDDRRVQAGAWIPQRERETLLQLATDALAGDLERFSDEPLQRVGKAMASSGWFAQPPIVRREHGGRVVVEGAWRVPAAVVRKDGVDQLISWDAYPMPLSTPPGESGFAVIDSPVRSAPRTVLGGVDHGEAWSGEDIAVSLELLDVVLRKPWGSQVGGVDAARWSAERSLVLTTTFGTRVVWGGRATKPALGEVTTERKLAHLGDMFASRGRIDAGYPMIYVNNAKLQFDISATAEALAKQQELAEAEAMRQELQEREAREQVPQGRAGSSKDPSKNDAKPRGERRVAGQREAW